MPRFVCACGAKYKLPAASEGKRAKCKRCGQAFVVPSDAASRPAPASDDDPFGMLEAAAAAVANAEAAAPSALSALAAQRESAGPVRAASGAVTAPVVTSQQGGSLAAFIKDAFWQLLFIAHPSNLVIMLLVWFALILQQVFPFAGCVGAIASLIVTGWYFSFLLNTITSAASGEDDLPKLSFTEGVVDDVLFPLLRFAGTWLVLLAPAIAYVVMNSDRLTPAQIVGLLGGPVGVLANAADAEDPLLWLTVLAVFLWPACILAVALGGLSTVVRVDRTIMTILKTFIPYVVTCVFVALSVTAKYVLTAVIFTTIKFGTAQFAISQVVIAGIVTAGVVLYFDILAMRIVGLYYRHFKKKFAWGWD